MVRITISLDEDLYARLRRVAPDRDLDRVITQAVAEKIATLEHQLARAMREGYVATRDDRATLNEIWSAVDIEGWPE